MDIRMENINTFLIDFPANCNEMVVKNEDDSYTIFINAQLSNESRIQAYKHALRHIAEGDFYKADVQEIEYSAHYPSPCCEE